MKNKKNTIIYLIIEVILLALVFVFWGRNDMMTMILFSMLIVVTSIFLYGTRRT